jgi:hypothetical protein
MPTLIEDTDEDHELSLQFNLLGLATDGDQGNEAWVAYSLALFRDESEIISTSGTILPGDIAGVIELCAKPTLKGDGLEPVEPDFELSTQLIDNDYVQVTCSIDDKAAISQVYGNSGIGLTFSVHRLKLTKFGDQLNDDLEKLLTEAAK